MIKYRISQYIEKEELLSLRDKVLVTLSGGADSVALLRILLSLGYTCEAAHCNFHLRGSESDRDENFVRRLCNELQIKLHTTHFNTQEYARDKKISIEMSARELRYQWFDELANEHHYTAIAVAHHQDDSVETMLLNLIRGTGLNGLLGIRPRNGKIVRPLLGVTRREITDYLQCINQEYVTDSTNLQDEYIRNKIRLKLIPLMQEINPSVKDALFRTTNHLNEISRVYHRAIEEGKSRVQVKNGIHIPSLHHEPSASALLFEILYPLGYNPSQIENIFHSLEGESGKQFISNEGYRVIKNREHLIIERIRENHNDLPPFHLTYEEETYVPGFTILKDKHIAYFDADKLKGVFLVRKWRHGDKFVPFGMKGKKLISDFLTDIKFSIAQKENQWVLCSGEEIAWVIGERTDDRFRIDHATRRVIVVKLQ